MYSHFLVLIAFWQMDDLAPKWIEGFDSAQACLAAAQQRNHKDDRLKTEAAIAQGLRYACLKLESDA